MFIIKAWQFYVLGGCRKGRADKLLSIAIGSFIPGVSLNNEFLPSQTQTTPADGEKCSNRTGLTIWRISHDMSVCLLFSRASDVAEAVQGKVKLRAAANDGRTDLLVVSGPHELHT